MDGDLWKMKVFFDNRIQEFVLDSFFIVMFYIMDDVFKNCGIIGFQELEEFEKLLSKLEVLEKFQEGLLFSGLFGSKDVLCLISLISLFRFREIY